MKIACISLGCPKNQVDLDGMVHILLSAGHETVADLGEADVILVNTCGFIESAKTEAIENILEACSYKQANPNLKVIVTGCLAERYRSQIEEEIPEVDAVVGCASNKAIDSIVARLFNGEDHLESYGLKKDFPLGGKRVIGTPAHYAYLKIAEGCNNRCHYCAIPAIRGPLRSRDMADCVAEARWLAGEGVKELIIVAQDPTAYGEDWGKPGSICELLDKLNKINGIEWIRIMYAYPERITDDFIAAMKRNEKVLPYLDLPIQHCNDVILKNMNRRSNRAELLEVIGKLRREIPGITLRTTLIAGFPGETEEQFEDLCNFVKEVRFDRLGLSLIHIYHLGKKAEDILLAAAAVVGGLFAILLFTVLPTVLVGGLNHLVPLGRWGKVILEAVLKVGIFLTYMGAISKMKEIHRVFEYHGAEHKTIACYEAGDPLTVENVRKYTRFHPRCGTSFLILVVIVSVFLYSVLPWSSTGLRVVFKLLLLPVVMGISYELLKWCGRSDNIATRIIRQPGIWVQHLTVFEPDDSMIEVAIAAVTPVLPENPEDGKW